MKLGNIKKYQNTKKLEIFLLRMTDIVTLLVMVINFKMPTIVGILKFTTRTNFLYELSMKTFIFGASQLTGSEEPDKMPLNEAFYRCCTAGEDIKKISARNTIYLRNVNRRSLKIQN